MKKAKYLPIIGLEVHIELKTKSKMFCSCSADYFGSLPNTHVCPTCLGLPGALPVPNKKAIERCVKTGIALNCKIPEFSKFDRKNYFYPDLPKGYQISQYDAPFCENGWLEIGKKKIRIRRVHMEEDTAKLIHKGKSTLIDFNRSGVPLMEIVTEPDINNSSEAKIYLKKLQQIVRYLGVSDCDMEKGSMRIEPNISMLKITNDKFLISNQFPIPNDQLPKYKIEIKNINSFKFVEKAIEYEIKRQQKLLEAGEKLTPETRGWDEIKQITFSQRVKETAADYRYFPEPDIPPIKIKNLKFKIKNLPELPDEKIKRFVEKYGLLKYQIEILIATREKADYFEEAVKIGKKNGVSAFKIANIIINKKINIRKYLPIKLIKLLVKKKTGQITDKKQIRKLVKKVLSENQKAVEDYKKGKQEAVQFLIGCIMKKTKGKADAKITREILLESIKV